MKKIILCLFGFFTICSLFSQVDMNFKVNHNDDVEMSDTAKFTANDTMDINAPVSLNSGIIFLDTLYFSTNTDTLFLLFNSKNDTVIIPFSPSQGGDGGFTQEEIEDFVGGMITGNTETLIDVTYDDGAAKLNFVVDNNLSNYDNTTSAFITGYTVTEADVTAHEAAISITESQISDLQSYALISSLPPINSSGNLTGNLDINGNVITGLEIGTDIQSYTVELQNTTAPYTDADSTKLDGIETGATADQTDSEIETSYNNQVSIVSQNDAETGTSTTVYRWTPLRVSQAIAALTESGDTLPLFISNEEVIDSLQKEDNFTDNIYNEDVWSVDSGVFYLDSSYLYINDTVKIVRIPSLTNSGIADSIEISTMTDAGAFESGDKLIIYESGIGNRKIDWDDLPGAGGGLSNIVEDATPQLGGDLDLNGNNIDFPTTPNISDVLDEDDMTSNSATVLATQQSIKAYVDNNFTSQSDVQGIINDTMSLEREKTRTDTVEGFTEDTIVMNSVVQFDKSTSVLWDSIAYSATLNLDFQENDYKYVLLTGDATVNISSLPDGESTLWLQQDGTGGHTITIGTGWGDVLDNTGTLSESIDAINIIQFQKYSYSGGSTIIYGIATEGN